ncbi:50S ribosomal protein L13 [Candidatus Babeliales bacterium]|nr:50S ribosomal protein L13 [Candidatus Babeliales bacterium]
MNKTFMLRKEDRKPEWHVIDASGLVLGRLATRVADVLRGKNRPEFTPHEDAGDYVVIINCEKIALTGEKMAQKIYTNFSGWRGGLKELTARQVFEKNPARIIEQAVKGMLPKNKLSDRIIKKLKVYKGTEHPHKAQIL